MSTDAEYWNARYSAPGGFSGNGSRGRLALVKASFINYLINLHDICSILEIGCGDAFQSSLFSPHCKYVGTDISDVAVHKNVNSWNDHREFITYEAFSRAPDAYIAEMTISLDVIIHITGSADFLGHINHLVNSSSRFICIYSSGFSHASYLDFEYMRSWDITSAFKLLMPELKLIHYWANPFPYKEELDDPNTSVSDFFVFEKGRKDIDIPGRYWTP